jgi:hypothetical protein
MYRLLHATADTHSSPSSGAGQVAAPRRCRDGDHAHCRRGGRGRREDDPRPVLGAAELARPTARPAGAAPGPALAEVVLAERVPDERRLAAPPPAPVHAAAPGPLQ